MAAWVRPGQGSAFLTEFQGLRGAGMSWTACPGTPGVGEHGAGRSLPGGGRGRVLRGAPAPPPTAPRMSPRGAAGTQAIPAISCCILPRLPGDLTSLKSLTSEPGPRSPEAVVGPSLRRPGYLAASELRKWL